MQNYQVWHQTICPRGCKVTLAAFVANGLFSTVRFQMKPQIVFSRRCIVTFGYICLIFQHFSSRFSHWHPSNQSHNFLYYAPLPLCDLLCPNCCFKLSQIYYWLLISNNQNSLLFYGMLSLFQFKGKFLGERKYLCQISWKKRILQKKWLDRTIDWFFNQICWSNGCLVLCQMSNEKEKKEKPFFLQSWKKYPLLCYWACSSTYEFYHKITVYTLIH